MKLIFVIIQIQFLSRFITQFFAFYIYTSYLKNIKLIWLLAIMQWHLTNKINQTCAHLALIQ